MYESRLSKETYRKVFELTLALYRVTDFFPHEEVLAKQMREKANEVFGGVIEYGYTVDIELEAARILRKIETLHGYLEIVRSLQFVHAINITVLTREYDLLADFFMRELEGKKKLDTNLEIEKLDNKESKKVFPKENTINALSEDSMSRATEEKTKIPSFIMSPTTINNSVYAKKEAHTQFSNRDSKDDLNNRQKRILDYIQNKEQAKISDFYTVFNEISSKTIQRDLQDLVSKNILKKEGDKRWTTYFRT